jgi:hypothetical protein
MKRSYIGLALGTLVAVGAALSLPSCGHDQKLTGLTIQPQTFTFLTPDPQATEQLTALGTYIHPPATMNITQQVKWSVDFADVVTISQSGVVSPVGTGGCGGVDITATAPAGTGGSNNVVVAVATVTVDDPSNVLCPGGGKLATLAVGVVGAGTVTSLPAAINCSETGGTCVSTYDVGASVLLTANGPTVTWGNCPGNTGNTCVVTIPAGGTAVSATF